MVKKATSYTAAVWQEEDLYVAQCLGIDIASQGESPSEAVANLQEAVELYTVSEFERVK